jgi:DnaK suppressor protein
LGKNQAKSRPAMKQMATTNDFVMMEKKTMTTLLTKEQLLAAPADEYMSAAQLAFFRAMLETERDKLMSQAQETLNHIQDAPTEADPNDRASLEEEHTTELRVRDRERKLLSKIRKALVRIEEGDYGWCSDTGEPIGIPRLLARPTAELCIEAQQRHELLEKMHG